MLKWVKNHFCFHKWEHLETNSIQPVNTNPPYFVSIYRCTKCGKTKNTCIYP